MIPNLKSGLARVRGAGITRLMAKALRLGAGALNHTAIFAEQHPFIRPRDRAVLARNSRFKGRWRGSRAFVIGNGPSLQKNDLALLKGENVLVVNGFAVHPILSQWQPKALALLDPLYHRRPDSFASEFALMNERLGDCDFFLPLAARGVLDQPGRLPPERCYFCHFSGDITQHRLFNYDLTRALPNVQTVSLFALLIAMYMGCNPIYLAGMDLNFLAVPGDAGHFSRDYEASVKDPVVAKLLVSEWQYLSKINAVQRMFEGYARIAPVAHRNGIRICNATEGGFLDIFERVDYKSLFPAAPG